MYSFVAKLLPNVATAIVTVITATIIDTIVFPPILILLVSMSMSFGIILLYNKFINLVIQ